MNSAALCSRTHCRDDGGAFLTGNAAAICWIYGCVSPKKRPISFENLEFRDQTGCLGPNGLFFLDFFFFYVEHILII